MGYEELAQLIIARFEDATRRFDSLEERLHSIQKQLGRIELSQQEDVIGMLNLLDKKVSSFNEK